MNTLRAMREFGDRVTAGNLPAAGRSSERLAWLGWLSTTFTFGALDDEPQVSFEEWLAMGSPKATERKCVECGTHMTPERRSDAAYCGRRCAERGRLKRRVSDRLADLTLEERNERRRKQWRDAKRRAKV